MQQHFDSSQLLLYLTKLLIYYAIKGTIFASLKSTDFIIVWLSSFRVVCVIGIWIDIMISTIEDLDFSSLHLGQMSCLILQLLSERN